MLKISITICSSLVACISMNSCTQYSTDKFYRIIPKVHVEQEGVELMVNSEECEATISTNIIGRRTTKVTNCVESKNDDIEWRFGSFTKTGRMARFEITEASPNMISATINDNGVMYTAEKYIEEIEKNQEQVNEKIAETNVTQPTSVIDEPKVNVNTNKIKFNNNTRKVM